MPYGYRYNLDGNGPYESEQFDTEDAAREAAASRRQTIDTLIEFDSTGAPKFANDHESITLSDTDPTDVPKSDVDPSAVPPAEQEQTTGQQPA